MSSLLLSTLTASSTQEKLYVDDVFSAYLYTGNGSTQTINNGIDLAGKGGLVWVKRRGNLDPHMLTDSARGFGSTAPILATDQTAASSSIGTLNITAQSSGFQLVGSGGSFNVNTETYVSWTFRRAERFFDVVTYTGDGTNGRQIAHSLGVAPGFITTKSTTTNLGWYSYHRSATGELQLQAPDAQYTRQNILSADTTSFTVASVGNANGTTYVAYLFAHDPSVEGIVQCGSVLGAGNPTAVTLGWEPQFLLIKNATNPQDWWLIDSARGLVSVDGAESKRLHANASFDEVTCGGINMRPTATGFISGSMTSGQTYIYLAIRRPNKPPTSGTQVYNAIARTGTGKTSGGTLVVSGVGFPPDVAIAKGRTGIESWANVERIRGSSSLGFSTTSGENTNCILYLEQDGYKMTQDASANWDLLNMPYINHFFRRATGFFDIVCYTGTGAARTVDHSLGVLPELMIVKSRSGDAQPWAVYHIDVGATKYLLLNSASTPSSSSAIWNDTSPTSASFSVGGGNLTNLPTGRTYVAYLFASLPGISKVGSYTGNGSTQTIDCGFSTGARFFLVKSTSTTGSWWVFDSARGIVSSFDPALQLNSTAAEITSADAVDPTSVGIIVNQETTCSINATGVSYIFLAIA